MNKLKEYNPEEELLRLYRERISPSMKLAFSSAVVLGLLVHLYKFTNNLPNHDTPYNYCVDQTVLSSGRWLLGLACGFSSNFDLPWVIGLFSVLLVGLTMAVMTELLSIKSPVLICLASGLVVAFPGITETFFFEFTADGYMLAMLLATVAVRLSPITARGRGRVLLSALCICCTLGIYQAYLSFAMVLALCYFMLALLEGDYTDSQLRLWVGKQVVIFALGTAAYYVIWKLLLAVQGVSVGTNQGMDQAGLSLGNLLNGFVASIQNLLFFLVEWNVFKHGLTLYGVLNLLFAALAALALVGAILHTALYRKRGRLALFLLSLAAIPFVASIWCFVSDEVLYRPMMLMSLAVFYIFVGILYQRYFRFPGRALMGLLLAAMVLNNSLSANIAYRYLNRCYYATYAQAVEMISRIHSMDATGDTIAVIGDNLIGVQLADEFESSRIHLFNQGMETTLLYDRYRLVYFLNESFYCSYTMVDQDTLTALEQSQAVQEMGCWPASDAVQEIDGIIVIKLAEPEEE